ncbi:MAG TPA: STAS/SEC14 domain-containing protein [Candidatus Saccharimonadales bacterium]|nr:STAS/SEC14 domain-containing protein [Candidatus Saccharimonadales bacterium]
MANTVYLHNDGYIYVSVVGDQTAESVKAMGDEVKLLLEKQEAQHKPRLIFDDITKIGHTDIPARRMVADLAKTMVFDRVAMIGDGTTLMRVGTNLMLKAIGRSNVRYFDDPKRAAAWLTKGS